MAALLSTIMNTVLGPVLGGHGGWPWPNEKPPNWRDIDFSVISHPVLHFVYICAFLFFFLHFLLEPMVKKLLPRLSPDVAHLLTFELLSGLACTYLSTVGALLHYFSDSEPMEDKLFGFDPRSLHIAQFMTAYQLYDLLIMAFVPRLFTVAMLIHHVLSGLLGFIGLFNFAHGYASFFFGVIEISNVILTVVDIFKYTGLDRKYLSTYTMVRMLFALTFAVFRLILWPIQCFDFWGAIAKGFTSNALLQTKMDTFAGTAFFLSNLALTALQLYWGTIIVKGSIKVIRKAKQKGKKERDIQRKQD